MSATVLVPFTNQPPAAMAVPPTQMQASSFIGKWLGYQGSRRAMFAAFKIIPLGMEAYANSGDESCLLGIDNAYNATTHGMQREADGSMALVAIEPLDRPPLYLRWDAFPAPVPQGTPQGRLVAVGSHAGNVLAWAPPALQPAAPAAVAANVVFSVFSAWPPVHAFTSVDDTRLRTTRLFGWPDDKAAGHFTTLQSILGMATLYWGDRKFLSPLDNLYPAGINAEHLHAADGHRIILVTLDAAPQPLYLMWDVNAHSIWHGIAPALVACGSNRQRVLEARMR